MPLDSLRKNGAPNWADCATLDLDAAEAFYRTVFGWQATRETDSTGSIYSVQWLDGKRVAGVYELTKELRDLGVPPHWATYFGVADLDDTLAKVKEAGGKLWDGPIDEPGVGRMAVIQDDVGAYLRLWVPAEGKGGETFSVPGSMVWNELCTEQPERAHVFYSTVLGLDVSVIDAGGRPYTLLKAGGDPVAGVLPKPPEMRPGDPTWDVYFAVDDVDAVVALARKAGGSVIAEPFDLPVGGRMAALQDPFGAVFEIMQSDE